jgi:hypothetical protein
MVSPINLSIWEWLDLYELYPQLQSQVIHNYGSQNTELAKVNFDKVLIDSASTVGSIKIQMSNI